MSQSSQKNTFVRVTFFTQSLKKLYSKETLALVFSCEFCGIFENIFFTEHLRTTASVFS